MTPSRARQYFSLLETTSGAANERRPAAAQHEHEHETSDDIDGSLPASPLPSSPPSAPTPKEAWRAASDLLPPDWPERERASGDEFDAARRSSLRFASRRHRDPEDPRVLADEPIPRPHVPTSAEWPGDRSAVSWPSGAPPRPINQHQLWADCISSGGQHTSADQTEINEWIARASAAVAALEAIDDARQAREEAEASARRPGLSPLTAARLKCKAEQLRAVERSLPRPRPPTDTLTYPQGRLAVWAQGVIWNSENPLDCYPEQPSTASDPPSREANVPFFEEWAERLGWTDFDMIHQIASGVDSRSSCELATVLRFHHKGFQKLFSPARASIDKDAAPNRRWISTGRPHLTYVPSRLIARNVAERHVWRMRDGQAVKVLKYRVTTDDSIEDDDGGVSSRNNALPRDDWPDLHLPHVQQLGRAVAILRQHMPQREAERLVHLAVEAGISGESIVLWAIDLSDAYRHLGIQRLERWLQAFIWSDGCRTDERCVFGTAHMVQFFERVSTFLLAIIAFKHREFDASRPYSEARQAWMRRKGESDPAFRMIYIDDGIGAVVHAPGEPIHRRTDACGVVVDPNAEETRVEAYVRIASETAGEAGWPVQGEKVQADRSIDALGFLVDANGEGRIGCTPAKRAGISSELEAHQQPDVIEAPTDEVESVAGKLIHLAEVIVEGRAHLEPFYTFLRATRRTLVRGRHVRIGPSKLAVGGANDVARRYQRSASWWRAALDSDVSVPLAPRLTFPAGGDAGCVVTYQDAARGLGTGYGGFAPLLSESGVKRLPFVSGVWPADIQQLLVSNVLSMAAGEMFAFASTAASIAHHVGGVTHVVGLTDSSATAAAINSGASGSPQMQALLLWLYELCPGLQLLAIWLPGVENTRSDSLSRGVERAATVVAEADAAGWQTAQLPLPPHALDHLRSIALLAHNA